MNQSSTPVLTFGNPLETFGNRLEFIRRDHLLSIKAMASSVGVAAPTWRSYEKDKTFPSPKTLWTFCGIYHVNREWLDRNEGEPYVNGYKPGDPLGEPGNYDEILLREIGSVFQNLFKTEERVDKAIEIAAELVEMEDEAVPDDPKEGLSKIVDGLQKLQSQIAAYSDSMDSETLESAEHFLDLAIESVIDVMDENGWVEI